MLQSVRTGNRCCMTLGALCLVIATVLFAVALFLPRYYTVQIDDSTADIKRQVDYGALFQHFNFSVGPVVRNDEGYLDENCQFTVKDANDSGTHKSDPFYFDKAYCKEYIAFRSFLIISGAFALVSMILMWIGICSFNRCNQVAALLFSFFLLVTACVSLGLWVDLIRTRNLTTLNDADVHHFGVSFWLHVAAIPVAAFGMGIYWASTGERQVYALAAPVYYSV